MNTTKSPKKQYDDEYYRINKEQILARQRAYRKERRKDLQYRTIRYAQNRKYNLEHKYAPDKTRLSANQKAYYNRNRERIITRGIEYRKHRYRIDPVFKVKILYRSRLHDALKTQLASKNTKSCEICGCAWDELKSYIENQFRPGMTWDNHGEWHIDHIRPCCSFNLADEQQLKECFHYTNLQPLWAEENLLKSGNWYR